jgi:flagellar biosynthesis/type III secretory pathway chaperone
MSTDSPLKKPFRATVDATLNELRGLIATLQDEHAALTGSDPRQLEESVQRKNAQLQQLEHGILAREHIQKQAGCEAGLAGAEQFMRKHFTADEILADWQALKQLSQQAEQLNTQNGKLALAGERTTRQALGILTGRTEQNDTYGRHARPPSSGSLSLGKC